MASSEEVRWQRHLQSEYVEYEHYDRDCSDNVDTHLWKKTIALDQEDAMAEKKRDGKTKKDKKEKKKKKEKADEEDTSGGICSTVTHFKSRSEKEAEAARKKKEEEKAEKEKKKAEKAEAEAEAAKAKEKAIQDVEEEKGN